MFGTVDPPDHTHTSRSILGEDGETLVGPKGDVGDTGSDGAQGPKGDKGDQGDKGDRGEPGHDAIGEQGPVGPAGRDGTDGNDAVLPAGLVTISTPDSALFGDVAAATGLRLVSGRRTVSFAQGHGAFALPDGTQGIASIAVTLIGREEGVGVASPTDASAIGLLANVDGTAEVAYFALIW